MLNSEILWAEVKSQIVEACNAWFVAQCQNPFERMYLYFLRSTETENGKIVISATRPGEGWQLGWNERISPAKTVEQVVYQITELCKGLPLLKYG